MVVSNRFRALLVVALLIVVIGATGPVFAQKDQFPKTMEAARRFYEEERPLKDWAGGPVEYLLLDYERDTWKEQKTDELRRQFIEWFWGRRDLDTRDQGHVFQEEFYRRVGFVNERFHGFPRGWRSDRGRVWVILGRPTGGMRRRDLRGFGRCSYPEGEWWTYRTNNMAFRSQMGEFHVVFVETRIGQFELCDPGMLGVGGMPTDLRTAFLFTNEGALVDTVTEFRPGAGMASTTVAIRETVARTEPLTVLAETWGINGVAGALVIPIEIPLRDLLFEPVGDGLRATLRIDASLVSLGDTDELSGTQEWIIDLPAADVARIRVASLRTALLLRAAAGGYTLDVRVLDPLSGTAFTWDGEVEISDSGSAVSPLIIGRSLTRLREGEVGIISGVEPRLSAGDSFSALTWLRGKVPDAEAVRMTLVDSAGAELELQDVNAAWGDNTVAGPLIVQAMVPAGAAGDYLLRLSLNDGAAPLEAKVRIE